MAEKIKLIIDCDAGIDDSYAILMALAQPHVEVKAITCVFGNTQLPQICANVLRVLKVCDRLDVSIHGIVLTYK